MLRVEDLTVHYGRIAALRNVSLEVAEGSLVGAIGPNGAGKSTLLRTIAGALRATSGSIVFEGQSLAGKAPEEVVKMGVALVPERRRIFTRLSVKENLELGATIRTDRADVTKDIQLMTERFPILGERFSASAGTLSGGEQQQLSIARALLARPRLLLVDEPSIGLAPKLVEGVFRALEDLRDEGVTILLVEQNAFRTIQAADRAYILRNGQVDVEGSRDEIREAIDVRSAYFGWS